MFFGSSGAGPSHGETTAQTGLPVRTGVWPSNNSTQRSGLSCFVTIKFKCVCGFVRQVGQFRNRRLHAECHFVLGNSSPDLRVCRFCMRNWFIAARSSRTPRRNSAEIPGGFERYNTGHPAIGTSHLQIELEGIHSPTVDHTKADHRSRKSWPRMRAGFRCRFPTHMTTTHQDSDDLQAELRSA